jgi:uncharacterized membrane-anchored protein
MHKLMDHVINPKNMSVIKKIRGINVTKLKTHLPPSTLVPMQLSSLTPITVSALFKASHQAIQNKSRFVTDWWY